MHEMSLCESVLQIVEENARSQAFQQVRSIRLEIGKLSGVEVEAMRFCFDVVARGSVLEGAQLLIDEPAGEAWCMPCGCSVTVAEKYSPCPQCGSYQLQVTAGDQMRISELEVD